MVLGISRCKMTGWISVIIRIWTLIMVRISVLGMLR